MIVRDDPDRPDARFAELYDRLAPAAVLEPWLSWCREARSPVLYLGIGAGRLAAPLAAAGVGLVGVDANPAMLARLHRRLPGLPVHFERLENLDLGPVFDLVIAPSNLLGGAERLAAAAAHLAPRGRLGLELMNPHWLRSGASPGVRLGADHGAAVDIEVDYVLSEGEIWTQVATGMPVHAPEDVESRLEAAGLRLLWMGGAPGLGLLESPTYYVLAAARPGPRHRPRPAQGRPEAAPGRAARGRPRRPASH